MGLGEAARIAGQDMEKDKAHIEKLSNKLYHAITDNIADIYLNGDEKQRIHGMNLSFAYIEGESLIMALKDLGAVSSGSACTSASLEPSYVLHALGVTDDLAHTSIRFGIGRFTTEAEIDHAIKIIHTAVKKLRELSPLWEMAQEGIDLQSIKWDAH